MIVEMKKYIKLITNAGVVLVLAGVVGASEAHAEEDNKVGVETVTNSQVLLRDQTFTLGRLKIDKGTFYEYRESIPNSSLAESVISQDEGVVTPLPDDFEGYVEVRGRIKSGDKTWLEITVNGEPAGYITQNRLEVQPLTRTESQLLPKGIKKANVLDKSTVLYKNLNFMNTEDVVLAEGTEYTILGLYDVTFYNKPVESVKVRYEDGHEGWVKASDIKGLGERDINSEFRQGLTSQTNGEEEESETETLVEDLEHETKEDIKVTLRPHTVTYSEPTYIESSEVLGTSFAEVEVEVIDVAQDDEVKNTFYKVFTKNGTEGYIMANDYTGEVEREIVAVQEHVQDYVLTKPSVLTNLPIGLEGARDLGMVDTGISLTSVERVEVRDVEEDKGIGFNGEELDLETEEVELVETEESEEDALIEEVETEIEAVGEEIETEQELGEISLLEDELDSLEKELESMEGDLEVDGEQEDLSGVYYKLIDTLTGDFKGYAHESVLEELEQDKSNLYTVNEEEDESEETEEDNQRVGIVSNDLGSVTDIGESQDISGLQGWDLGEVANSKPQEYVAPSSATSQVTVNFIKELAPYTQQVKDGGLYPSVMIAQAILESDSGRSGLARNDNNLFGIKGSYNGQSTTYATQEATGVQFYGIRAGFRKYPSLREGIADYVTLLNNSNYTRNGVVNANSAFESVLGLKSAGYATDPLYVPKVWRVIDGYNLTQFD